MEPYVNQSTGAFLGYFSEDNPSIPDGAIKVQTGPRDGKATWNGSQWVEPPSPPNIDGFFNDLDADPLFDSVAGNKVYMDLLGVAQSVAQQIAAGNVQRVQKRFALLASQLPTDMAAAIQQHANNNGIPL